MVDLLRGCAASDAVLRVLAPEGKRLHRRDVDAALKDGDAPAALASLFAALGYLARPIRVDEAFLCGLDGPALVEAAGGGWLGVAPGLQGLLRVTSAEGESTLSFADLLPSLGGWAVEIRPTAPAGSRLYARVLQRVLQHRKILGQVAATTLLMQGLNLLIPQFTRLAMDQALPAGAMSLLSLVAVAWMLSAAFQAWTGWLRQKTVLYLETKLEAELGREYLGHVLSLPFSLLQKHKMGELMQAQNGLEVARSMLTERMLGNILDGFTAVIVLGVMATMMPGPTLAVALCSLVLVALIVGVGRAQENLQRKEVQASTEERGFLVELLKGVATVKAAGSEKEGLRHWTKLLGKELGYSLHRQRVGLWSEVGLDGIRQALSVAILVWGGSLVLQGQVQVGSLMAFAQLTGSFLGAMLGMAQAYLAWRMLRPQLERTQALLAETPEPAVLPGSGHPVEGAVVVEDLWFRYGPDLPWVLKGYSLRVEPGEKRWIHAPSGFGKTTLLRLLAGLCTPDRGLVNLGGQTPAAARGQLVYLPQMVQLYGGTIMENLRLLSGGASTERIIAAAETSGLAKLIEDLPMGYHTVIAHGGGNFSGGQRQLIALTAAMASECKLLLLDEAMANLDWVSRNWLHQSSWFEGKTVIYASHDAGLA